MTVSTKRFVKSGKTYAYHQVSYIDHTGRRRSRSFKTKSEAQAFANQVPIINHVHKSALAHERGAEMALNVFGEVGAVSVDLDTLQALQRYENTRLGKLSRWIEKFVDASEKGRDGAAPLEPSTIRTYRRQLGYAAEYLGTREAGSITRDDVIALRDELVSGGRLSPASVAGVINALKILFGWMLDIGEIRGLNPARKISTRSKKESGVTAVTEEMIHTPAQGEKIKKLLDDKISSPDRGRHRRGDAFNRALVFAAIYTGMRNGEIRALQWKHIDFDSSLVLVRQAADMVTDKIGTPKTQRSVRSIAMHPRLAEALRLLRDMDGATDPERFIFTTKKNEIITYNYSVNTWKRVQAEAGVPVKGFHSARHYFASVLFDSGYNEVRVSEMLGHHSVDFTRKVYVHMIDKQKRIRQDVEDIKNALL